MTTIKQPDLMGLALLVEAAEGPSRDIDLSIMRWVENIGGPAENAAHYTSSLDAAMSLVPEGWAWSVINRLTIKPNAQCWDKNRGDSTAHGDATTPALALVAASLRARARSQEQ